MYDSSVRFFKTSAMIKFLAGSLLLSTLSLGVRADDVIAGSDVRRINAFSLRQLKLLAADADRNLVLSPPSVATVLAMMQVGARNNSHRELESALGMSGEKTRSVYGGLANYLGAYVDGPDKTLVIANKIFLQFGFTPFPSFSKDLKSYFSTEIDHINFRMTNSRKPICEWVSSHTQNKIRRIFVKDPPNNTEIVIASVFFYKSNWEHRFDKELTKLANFEVSPGKFVTVPTMHHGAIPARHGSSDKLQAKWVMLPFESGRFCMLVILPNNRFGLAELIKEMTGSDMNQILTGREYTNVEISLPKFKLTSTILLNEELRHMGIPSAFREANYFEHITKEPLEVGNLVHKAVFEVDETGGAGTASTGTRLGREIRTNSDNSFNVDHPFLAAVVETRRYLPVLFAVVQDPSKSIAEESEGEDSSC